MTPLLARDVSLAPFNTFGIDARARSFVSVDSVEALQAVCASAAWNDGPRLVLGGGSNILFTRDFDGLVVRIASRGLELLGDDGDHRLIAAEAGESWDGVVRATLAAGWPGLENLALIPGSVGASPVQNIGAYGVELAERFAWLDAMDVTSGEVRRIDAAACEFGYRDSVFKRALKDRVVITRVVFRLPKAWEPQTRYGDVHERLSHLGPHRRTATDVADVVTAIRREKLPDPAVCGNAGSFFKNPLVSAADAAELTAREPTVASYPQPDGRCKLAAAALIERCGWRGRALDGSSGRAAVHDRHALVLVNRGGATGAEVLALAEAIRESVETRFGVRLESEPSIF